MATSTHCYYKYSVSDNTSSNSLYSSPIYSFDFGDQDCGLEKCKNCSSMCKVLDQSMSHDFLDKWWIGPWEKTMGYCSFWGTARSLDYTCQHWSPEIDLDEEEQFDILSGESLLEPIKIKKIVTTIKYSDLISEPPYYITVPNYGTSTGSLTWTISNTSSTSGITYTVTYPGNVDLT